MSKIVNLALLLTVSVILAGSLLVPTITIAEEATYESVPYTVDSPNSIPMSKLTNGATLTCNAENITTASGVIEYWGDTTYFNTIILTDTIFLWSNGASISGGTFIDSYTGIAATSVEISVSSNTLTYKLDSADPVTIPYTEGYIANASGSYVSIFGTDTTPLYFKNDADLSGWRISSGTVFILLNGQGLGDGVPYSNIHINSTEVDDTDGQIKQLTSIAFGSKSINAYILPKTSMYQHTDNPGLVALYWVIPVIFLAALIAVAAYSIKSRV